MVLDGTRIVVGQTVFSAEFDGVVRQRSECVTVVLQIRDERGEYLC
jgi:hypothetical protein